MRDKEESRFGEEQPRSGGVGGENFWVWEEQPRSGGVGGENFWV